MTEDPDLAANDPSDERVTSRAAHPLPEEQAVGSDDPVAQADAILEESDERSEDRNAAPSSIVEHRTSEDTVG